MEKEKKSKFGAIVSGAGKTARNLFDKSREFAVRAADQNDDGKLDLADVSAIAGSMGDAVKKSAQAMQENAEAAARQRELKSLQPLFPSLLDSADFSMPKFIRVADRDKKHAESEVCQGPVGFIQQQKELRLVTLFKDSLDTFGLSFYPDSDCEFYYVDPTDRDCYISLHDYFSYLKTARVMELQKVAQDLGAKHFRITYMLERSANAKKATSVHVSAGTTHVDIERQSENSNYEKTELASEMTCLGHAPVRPQLRYLQRDQTAQSLIDARMQSNNPQLHHTYTLQMRSSSGLKETDAIKIDAILQSMKCAGSVSVTSQAQEEARLCLAFEIDY